MRKISPFTVAAAFSVALAGAAQAERIRYGDYMPQGANEYSRSAEWMGNEINKRAAGKHTVNMLWGGTVVKVGEVPTAVENKVIDMGPLVTPYFPDQFPINNAIPFFWPQPKNQAQLGELMLKWHDKYPAFAAELAKYKLKLVSVRPLPSYGIICTKPVRTMADFKGLRIRSYGIALPAMLEAIGAVPVSMADVDGYEALSNGILDCSPGDPPLTVGWKWSDVAKYYIDVPMGASWGHIVIMNLDKYNSLPADLKKIIDDMKHDYLKEFLASYDKSIKDTLASWKATGKVEVIKFPEAEFTKATLESPKVQAVRDSWIKRATTAGMPEADAKQVVDDITK
ncbi:TRAP transporter substrate-binding protein DctP [Bosea sp. 124]|uniref:TRAP transporter substrate-binding protein DctP n=1 Tax=Bosea sp. 124 TaxID=2135642 RepID=UPI000D3BEC12|nr:TRAP transporter substrate-binding protein DctP [Bosea sp. 124]PTM43406.1 TRAP-type C4-dicarboxylate transport system substrate-binding protein [Bosea sp. 124]